MSVVLAWDATPVCSTSATPMCSLHQPDVDLNLSLLDDGTGTVVASSSSFDNNYEAVIRQLTPNHDYRIRVTAASGSWRISSTYYGLAWYSTPQVCQVP